MAVGKKRTIVDSKLHVDGSQLVTLRNVDSYTGGPFDDFPPFVDHKDSLRALTGKMWSRADASSFAHGFESRMFTIEYEDDMEQDSDETIPVTTQTIRVVPNIQNLMRFDSERGLQFTLDSSETWRWLNSFFLDRTVKFPATATNCGGMGPCSEGEVCIDGVCVEITPDMVSSQLFQDCTFEYSSPFVPGDRMGAEVARDVGHVKVLRADATPEYNFFVERYEPTSQNTSEPALPCMYSFISEKESDYVDDDNSIYNQHISLKGSIKGVFTDVTDDKGKRIGERDDFISDYFKSWAKGFSLKPESYSPLVTTPAGPQAASVTTFGAASAAAPVEELFPKFRNIMFAQKDIDFLSTFAIKKESFPMNIGINFSTDSNIYATEVIEETGLVSDINNFILAYDPPSFGFISSADTQTIAGQASGEQTFYKMWNLNNWLVDWDSSAKGHQTMTEALGLPNQMDDFVVFGRNEDISKKTQKQSGLEDLLRVVLVGKMRKLMKQYNRSVQEIFEGKLAYSETILYEVEKYLVNAPTATGAELQPGSPIQRFFIPNSTEMDVCNFVDTQVKYDTNYRYEVHAYQMVFGTDYYYEALPPSHVDVDGWIPGQPAEPPDNGDDLGEPTSDWFGVFELPTPRFKVVTTPSLKLVRVPYFETGQIKVLDKPPIAPEVDIIPFKGVDNRVLFNLSAGIGNFKLRPEIIEPEEEQYLNEIREIQNVHSTGLINYVSDDPPRAFEMYRLRRKPETYKDFSGRLRETISTETLRGHSPKKRLSSASIIDEIRPNIKYYYTFRMIDVHDNLSYPTPIYQVEVINENGAIYLLVDIVKLQDSDSDLKVSSKAMNNQISILPSFPHRQVDYNRTMSNSGEDTTSAWQIGKTDLVMGLADSESMWGKKFKFRFTSKNTGKKFDLNVAFKNVFAYDKSREGRNIPNVEESNDNETG